MKGMVVRYLKSPRVIAGLLVLSFGLFLALFYDPAAFEQIREDYDPVALEERGEIVLRSTEERVQIMIENDRREQEKSYYFIGIAVCLGMGPLMVASGVWRTRRKQNRVLQQWEDAADTVRLTKLEQFFDNFDDDDLDIDD
ncbi:MAG: hypothetical protein K9L28_01715 [Synergistales bacterium]|nr:hypothetical protein [Synergistales bacterium]